MPHAIRMHAYGGPENLRREFVEVPSPGPGQVRLRQTAVGLNFIDVYERTGLYPVELPCCLGHEAAGVVIETGRGVRDVKCGDHVAYVHPKTGAYADERLMPADRLVPIPKGISNAQAAAVMLKGLTAWYLLHHTYRVRRGDPVVIYAAAGGVGLIAVQWARALGATVIAVTGSTEKAEIAREHGAHYTILLSRSDLAARVREITGGRGVPVVYDSIGKDTFLTSLDCLRPRGLQCLGAGCAGRPARTGAARFAVPDASDAVSLRGAPRGPAAWRAGAVCRHCIGCRKSPYRAYLCAGGRGAGAPRAGGPPHDRRDRAVALKQSGRDFRGRRRHNSRLRPCPGVPVSRCRTGAWGGRSVA